MRAIAACLLLASCGAARGVTNVPVAPRVGVELVVNGGFEQSAIAAGTAETHALVPGWTLAAGSGIELQRSIAGASFEGDQHVELDSDGSSAIYQDVTTVAGAVHVLELAYSPRPGVPAASNRIDVLFAGQRVLRITANGTSDTRWARVRVFVCATETTSRLALRDAGISDSVGGYLDAISLRATDEACTVLAPTAPPSGELLTNGDFEKPRLSVPFAIVTELSGWSLASGSGVEIQRGVAGTPFDGAQLAELDGDASSAIAQVARALEGGDYDLSFAYSPRPGVSANPIALSFAEHELGAIDASGAGLADTLWYEVSMRVRARTDRSRVVLRDAGASDGVGGYLDAISLTPSAP